jgi:hypothetical protein
MVCAVGANTGGSFIDLLVPYPRRFIGCLAMSVAATLLPTVAQYCNYYKLSSDICNNFLDFVTIFYMRQGCQ